MRLALPIAQHVRAAALGAVRDVGVLAALIALGFACLAAGWPGTARGQDAGAPAEMPVAGAPGTADEAVAFADAHPGSADAHLDAGILLAREDRIGRSLLYLERALLLAPLDRGIQDARLTVQREARTRRMESAASRTLTEGEPVALSWWRFFALLPESTYAGASLVGVWITFGLLLLRRTRRPGGARDAATVGAILGACVLALACAMWAGRAVTSARLRPAIVVDSEPAYRDAPDELSRLRTHADLYEGGAVLLVEERDGWRQVELVGGDRVWVAEHVVTPLERRSQPAP